VSAARARMRRRRRRRLIAPLLLLSAAALLVVGQASRSTGQEPAAAPSAQPWLGVLDQGGTLIDASPDEAQGEVWSVGDGRILRYTDADGWTAMPAPLDADGRPIATLKAPNNPLQGRATRDGAVALLANDTLLVRDPGGDRFHAAPAADRAADGATATTTAPASTSAPGSTDVPGSTSAPATTSQPASTSAPASSAEPATTTATVADATTTAAAGPPLRAGEKLYGAQPLVAALSERGRAGAFVVPTASGATVPGAVLHFDGTAWTREPICFGAAPSCDAADLPSGLKVVAIDAAGVGHAWLLATGGSAGVILVHRAIEGGDPVWRPVSLGGSPFARRTAALPSLSPGGPPRSATLGPRLKGQPLVATAQGVWADATIAVADPGPSDATLFYDESAGQVAQAWCGEPALCDRSLSIQLSAGAGRSFAWADGSPYGTRLITGLDQGAMLRLDGDAFHRVPTAGRGAGADHGAAFAAPDDGWLGANGIVARYRRTSEPNQLHQWPVPFRHPLTAIAAEPGKAVGAIDARALGVGDQGEVVRYTPGQGWSPEALLGATGRRATPRLRGVAWPAPDRAYAVGDGGEMWMWRQATGLWEPDPGKPTTAAAAVASFTGIAFDPDDPSRGYAVGKQGVLLGYDREWTQEPLPDGLGDANFTSIAFAGREAIVTYKTPIRTDTGFGYRGGIIVDDGSGWHEDPSLAAALPKGNTDGAVVGVEAVPERVAGLADGSAIVATMTGALAVRDGAGGAWHAADVDPVGFPAALSAFHDADGAVRALVSVAAQSALTNDLPYAQQELKIDQDTILRPAPPGQAPVLIDPYGLPPSGYVLRQTAHGWHDEQHQAWINLAPGTKDYDLPERPDPVLAFLTDPFGRAGWAVGGDPEVQTASVVRYPDDGQSAPGATTAPIADDQAKATFAIGGGARCLSDCADLEPVGAAPWRWLPAAVGRVAAMGRVRAFLYTGPGTADPAISDDVRHEQAAAADRLTSAAGALPVYAAAARTDRDGGSLSAFQDAFQAASVPQGQRAATGIASADVARSATGQGYYAFDSTGTADSADPVRVIVLDTSTGAIDDAQRCWLAQELSGAAGLSRAAIVVGSLGMDELSNADVVAATLVSGAAPTTTACPLPSGPGTASAYFYNSLEVNRSGAVTYGSDAIPAYGTGSLGYIKLLPVQPDRPPNSGFLLAEVDTRPGSRLAANPLRAPVAVRLIPNVAELAVDATDGTLLRRSQIALFDGLARRPRAGQGCMGSPACEIVPDPYTPIPDDCTGQACATTLAPEYTFTSSDPSVADFVARDPASTNPRRPLLDAKGDPVPSATSGLLCAYNAGTTTITLTSGGLSSSQKVTVQAGSVQRPCGTVPARPVPATDPGDGSEKIAPDAPPPAVEPSPAGGAGPLPPPPAPAAVKAAAKPASPKPPAVPTAPAFAPFVPVTSGLTQVIGVAPPPPPTAARPAPPSGTSSANVYQSAVAPERQREEEHQLETQSNAVRYEADRPLPAFVSRGGALLLIALAGLACTDLRPRPRRRPAFNTITNDRRDPRRTPR